MRRSQFFSKKWVHHFLGVMLWGLSLCGFQVHAAQKSELEHATQLTSLSTSQSESASKDIDSVAVSAKIKSDVPVNQCDQQSNFVNDKSGLALIGRIYPSRDLQVGDKVTVKVYDKYNRLLPEQLVLTIDKPQQGKAKQWAFQLAYNINHQFAGIRAGQKDKTGGVSPKYSCNLVYASPYSTVGHMETVFTIANSHLADTETVDNSNPISLANSAYQLQ